MQTNIATGAGAAIAGFLFVIALWIAAAVGWIWNIVKIVGDINDPITTLLIARFAGVPIAPLGIVLGYL